MAGLKGIVAPDGTTHRFDHEYLVGNPSIPKIDTTLTQEGQAADAGSVGKRILMSTSTFSDPNDDGNIVIAFLQEGENANN